MSILKYKYQAHKFVNYIFYIIVFAIGFFLGYAGKNIDFKKIIPNLLFIDNVSAYTIYEDNDVIIDDSNVFDWIDNNVPLAAQYDTSDFDIYVIYYYPDINSIGIRFMKSSQLSNFSFSSSRINNDFLYTFSWHDINFISYSFYLNGNYRGSVDYSSNTYNFYDYVLSYNNGSAIYLDSYFSNFDFPNVSDEINQSVNKLSSINLEFNPDLFANDSNFKEVCVDNHSSYVITRTSNPQNLDYMTDYDYIWFPYNIHPEDISLVNYENEDLEDLSSIDGVYVDSDHIFKFDNISYNFYNSKSKIDSIFSSENEGLNLEYKGYSNKYSYYGWSSLLFLVWFDYRDGNDFNFFPIITFDINHSVISLGSSSTAHGGGGRRLGIDDEAVSNEINLSESVCFYIKNEYVVTKVKTDEFNDFIGSVPTQNGDFDFYTSLNKNSMNSSDLFSTVTSFMSKISSTIHFINTNVYSFFLSFPLIVRMFIISCLTLFIIKLIIDMIVR